MGTITGTDGPETLNGTAGDDTIYGLGGNDRLNANGGHDILIGGAGADTLDGGPDSVTYQDTAADFNGDDIVNFKIGDKVQITDLNLAHGSVGLSGDLITYTYNDGLNSGQITLDNLAGGVGPGRLVLRMMNPTGVELRLQSIAHNDFNGDGKSDVLWRADDGTMTNWLGQSNGSLAYNAASYSTVATSWHIAGTGDFNGDGRADILWRADDGTMTNWLGQANGSFAYNAAS